jgi:hypothetical protein
MTQSIIAMGVAGNVGEFALGISATFVSQKQFDNCHVIVALHLFLLLTREMRRKYFDRRSQVFLRLGHLGFGFVSCPWLHCRVQRQVAILQTHGVQPPHVVAAAGPMLPREIDVIMCR